MHAPQTYILHKGKGGVYRNLMKKNQIKKETANFRIPLIIQEALGLNDEGIARVQDPISVGVPLADSDNIQATTELGLEGAVCGQFRALARWPSGNLKWVLVDTCADVEAGGITASLAVTKGNGNFGGKNLAEDLGTEILVHTGVAQFIIRKKQFNLFDSVNVGDRVLIAKGTSPGLVLKGPLPGQLTCGTQGCRTLYSSSLDHDSEVQIEENGPAKTVLVARGHHKDHAGNAYLAFTVRMTFWAGKSFVKVKSYLRNAEPPTSVSNTAYKEFASYDLAITPSIHLARNFAIANHAGITTGVIQRLENVFLYQAYSDYREDIVWSSASVRTPIPRSRTYPFQYVQEGYQIQKDNEVLAFEQRSQYPEGWAALYDETGAGIEIGVPQLSGSWPKSLEFNQGGDDIRIGLLPQQNVTTYWLAYPQYKIYEAYFNFHDDPIDYSGEFKKFQHPLMARADLATYNRARVFPYALLQPEAEDTYYRKIASIAKNMGSGSLFPEILSRSNLDYKIFRVYAWRDHHAFNQTELRFENLMKWLRWGTPGHYLESKIFYSYQERQAIPRADGFHWREQSPHFWNYKGYPMRSLSLHYDKVQVFRIDQDHAHWWGMTYYYFMSGDEGIKEAILDHKDRFNNPKTVENTTGPSTTLGVGSLLMSHAVLYDFLRSIGDPEAEQNLTIGDHLIELSFLSELEVSGFGPKEGRGTSRTRGVHWLYGFDTTGNRVAESMHHGMLAIGLYNFYQLRGLTTPHAQEILDLVTGIAHWWYHEAFKDTGLILNSGTIPYVNLDEKNTPSAAIAYNFTTLAYWAYTLTGERKFIDAIEIQLARNVHSNFLQEQIRAPIALLASFSLQPAPRRVQDLRVEEHQGVFSLSWTMPAGAEECTIKFSDKKIVEWLEFDNKKNEFTYDPHTHAAWFAVPRAVHLRVSKPGKQTIPLPPSEKALYIALKTTNQEGVSSLISNVVTIAKVPNQRTLKPLKKAT